MHRIKGMSFGIALLALLALSGPLQAGDEANVLSADGTLNLEKTRRSAPAASTAPAPAPAAIQASPSGSLLQTLGALLCIIGVAGGLAILARRVKERQQASRGRNSGLEIVERLALGPRREILLVRACEQLLVVAQLPQEIRFLTALPSERSGGQKQDALFADLLSLDQAPASPPAQTFEPDPSQPAPRVQQATQPRSTPERPLQPVQWP